MKVNIEILKKQILYRCYHTGTRETDLIYKKLIVNKINLLSNNELIELDKIINQIDDKKLYLILTKKIKPSKNLSLFKKLIS